MDNFNPFPKTYPLHDGWFLVLFDDYSLAVRQFINNKFILEDNDDIIIGWKVQG